MPTISYFYGIKIYIYWKDNQHHNIPHFHAVYNEHQAAFTLQGDILIGEMSPTAKKLVKTWALENEDMLYYAWRQAVLKGPVPKIKGLK